MSSNTLSTNPFFTPTQIAGCQLWLDAADSSSVVLSGTSVSQWNDKSGNARNFTQSTAASRPSFVSNQLNGYSIVRFASQFLSNSGFSLYANASSGCSFFTIFQTTNVNQQSCFFSQVWNGQNYTETEIGFSYASGAGYSLNNRGSIGFHRGNGAVTQTASNTITTATTYIYSGIAGSNGTTPSSVGLFLNGSQNNSIDFSSGGLTGFYSPGSYPIYTNAVYIAARNARGPIDNFMNGDIAEMIYFSSALPTNQRQQVEGYLAWKWGLVGNLPANHPYKNSEVSNINTIPPSLRSTLPTSMVPSSSPFTFFNPNSISNLATWLDGTDISTLFSDSNGTTLITSNSSPVRFWRDKSTNANNVRVPAGSNAPVYQQSTYNSQAVLSFSNSFFTAVTSGKVSCRTASIFAFYKSNPGQLAPIVYGLNSSVTAEVAMYPTYYFHRHGTNTDNGVGLADTFQPLVGEILYSDSTLLYFNNFSNISPASPILGTPGNTFYTNFFNIGTYQTGAGYTPNFLIGEVIIYNSLLSTAQRQQVEGYLAWKWGLQGSLPSSHPYKNAPPGLPGVVVPSAPRRLQFSNRGFSPLLVSGCQLWLDAADASTVVLSGVGVSQWTDKSGTGKNATQTNAAYRPTYGTVSGYRCISFRSVSTQHLIGVPLLTSLSYSLFFVCDTLTPNDLQFVFFDYKKASGSGTGQNFVQHPLSANSISASLIYQAEAPDTQKASNGAAIGTDRIQTGIFDSPTNVSDNFYVNGNSIGSTFTNNGVANITTDAVGYTLGAIRTGATAILSLTFNGNIYEVIVYLNEVSKNQRQTIEGYLAWKWGLVASLPANHPFKKWPPPPS